ncbi:MAG: esterase-like activity of phytase family protein [Sphingomonadales bacterium]|jgi:hypothetical protein|nr:esterase-like activity of phytase family protein [Sphingomonadales bacterium]MBK6720365.1 esterase-like activity of phytase family protein [Sphingomonadales bacterium]
MSSRALNFAALLLLVVLSGSAEEQTTPFAGAKTVGVTAKAVDISGIPHSGLLRPVRGWTLTSDDGDFGGLSALAAGRLGFQAISDTGLFVDLNPSLARADVKSMPRACVPHQLKRERDSESLARDARTGTVWIGFEYRNLICRIDGAGRAQAYAPPAMALWPKLGGPEAMLRRADGSFLVFAERSRSGGSVAPLLHFDRDPVDPHAVVTAMRYEAPAQYHPVDAAMLPDGRMLVVNRRYAFPLDFSAIVTLVEPFEIREGALVRGRPAILLAPPHIADNFEGITVDTRGARTVIWLAADNNFLPEQRTYLLEFELKTPRSGSDGR